MKPSKITIQISGVKLQLPSTVVRSTDWNGKSITPYIQIRQVEAASLIKQYVKARWPETCVNVTSQSYSGGCSCDTYLSNEYGFPVSETIYKDVENFAKEFQAGRFDGMTDCYNYNEVDSVSDNGTRIDSNCKYVFVNNRPKFGSKPDIVRSIREHMNGSYQCGVCTFEKAKTEVARYHKLKDVEKAIVGVDWKKAMKSK